MSQSLAFQARDLDAERALVSACVLMPELLDTVNDTVDANMFSAPQHRLVWQTLCELRDQKLTIDLVSVAGLLEQKGHLAQFAVLSDGGRQIHGRAALIELIDATPAVARPEELAQRIERLARVRRLSATCETIIRAELGTADLEGFLAQSERQVSEVVAGTTREEAEQGLAYNVAQRVVHQLQGGDPRSNSPVGFGGLGEILDTWKPKFYVVAGEPGSGKSALKLQMAESIARRGLGAVYLSFEMEREELLLRQLSQATGISARHLTSRFRSVRGAHLPRALEELPIISQLPMFYDYCPGLPAEGLIPRIRRNARILQRERGVPLGMVVIDYLQLIRSGEGNGRGTRAEDIARMTSELVALAGQLGVPIVAGSQLNRAHTKRDGKRPIMQDLRDSGGIEADAFAIMALFRPENSAEVECIVLKQRGGTTGTAYLKWEGKTTTFTASERRPIDSQGQELPREADEPTGEGDSPRPAPRRGKPLSQKDRDSVAYTVSADLEEDFQDSL